MTPEQLQIGITHLERRAEELFHQAQLARARADSAAKIVTDETAQADSLADQARSFLTTIDHLKGKVRPGKAATDKFEVDA